MPSLLSRVVERLVLLTGARRAFASEESLKFRVARARRSGPASPPRWMRRGFSVEEISLNGSRVFTVAPLSGEAGTCILYLHGGAFVFDITWFHWFMVSRLVRQSGCTVVVPLYPLAPEHCWKDVFDVLVPLHAQLVTRVGRENLVVMGDSAGGGVALSLAQHMRDTGLSLPARLILVSPGLDATFCDPRQPALAKYDCMLAIAGLKAAGRWYARDLSPADPKISPLFGSLAGLPPIAVFTGTRDLLNPDAHRLKAKAQQEGVLVDLRQFEGMFHVWTVTPIREARLAIAEMKHLIWNAQDVCR